MRQYNKFCAAVKNKIQNKNPVRTIHVSVSWGFIFIVVGWKGDYKVVGMDRDSSILLLF